MEGRKRLLADFIDIVRGGRNVAERLGSPHPEFQELIIELPTIMQSRMLLLS